MDTSLKKLRHVPVPTLGESDISAQQRRLGDRLEFWRRNLAQVIGASRLAGQDYGCDKTQVDKYPRPDRLVRPNTHFDFLVAMN